MALTLDRIMEWLRSPEGDAIVADAYGRSAIEREGKLAVLLYVHDETGNRHTEVVIDEETVPVYYHVAGEIIAFDNVIPGTKPMTVRELIDATLAIYRAQMVYSLIEKGKPREEAMQLVDEGFSNAKRGLEIFWPEELTEKVETTLL